MTSEESSSAREHCGGNNRCLPKLCGADFELGNMVMGVNSTRSTGALASHLLLREFDGVPLARDRAGLCYCSACTARRHALAYGYTDSSELAEECVHLRSDGTAGIGFNPQDWGRKFLSANGGCAYIDLDHLELCVPEVLKARDHVAATHAMIRMARSALRSANARLPAGARIVAFANNSDGQGHSYGSHLNFLMTRRAWHDLFERRLSHMLFLAAYQVSSIVFTGQGKVGSENNQPSVDYQISQRADFFEVLTGIQTTYNRPIVNSRDESLCGSKPRAWPQTTPAEFARLHVIFYDQTLCHCASFLKIGVMQIILAMIEAGVVHSGLMLEDPVEAVWLWSRDPELRACVRLASGKRLTAVELQIEFLGQARRFAAGGGCEGIVPEAEIIINLWGDTLEKLAARNFNALAPRLDWVLKLQLLERARAQRPGLGWGSPQLKHLDLMYGSIEDGLYWVCEREGAVERLVSNDEIERLRNGPPENTRAWTRARLLQLAKPEEVVSADWDSLTFSLRREESSGPEEISIELANPLRFTKADCACVFESSAGLEEALDLLGGSTADRQVVRAAD